MTPCDHVDAQVGLLTINPTETLAHLELVNKRSRIPASDLADMLRELNKHHPETVVAVSWYRRHRVAVLSWKHPAGFGVMVY